MVSHPADTLVSLGGQQVARAARDALKTQAISVPASEAEAWKDLVEALTEWGTSESQKPLSDRMEVGE